MVESDRSEEDRMDELASPVQASNNPTVPVGKRMREEDLEVEQNDMPNKKPRIVDDEESDAIKSITNSELNGTTEKENNEAADNTVNGKGADQESLSESDVGSSDDKRENPKKENENEDDSKKNGSLSEETSAPEKKTAEMSASDNEQDQKENESDDDKKSSNNSLVDGLELKVECASDKEASSSESENEQDKKPRPKTQIVKAEPNESELDVSSDEKKSDAEEEVSEKEIKREKKKGSKKSINDIKTSDSEESNSDDEDYSPRTKRKLKKSPGNKKTTKSSPGKRGRGRKRGRPRLSESKKSQEDDEESAEDETKETPEEEKKDKEEKKEKEKKEKKSSDSEKELSSSHSENESDNEEKSTKDGKQKKKESVKPDDDKRIKSMKKYIRAAGITVKCYNDLWSGCKSNTARVKRLKDLLEEHGIKGRPTLEKCKKIKLRNERMNEAAALDTKNIISEGRVTRARRNLDKSNTSPQQRESRNSFKRIQCIDSDSE